MKSVFITQIVLYTLLSVGYLGVIAKPVNSATPNKSRPLPSITEIRLWNDAQGERIALRSDGTASCFGLSPLATHRVGEYRGTFSPKEFQILAEKFNLYGFFSLKDSYCIPQTKFPDLYSIDVMRQGRSEKLILTNGGRVPIALDVLKLAIREVAATVVWQPGPSGIEGVVSTEVAGPLLGGSCILVMNLRETDVMLFPIDSSGRFKLPLPPATYLMQPMPASTSYINWPIFTVKIWPGKYTLINFLCKPVSVPSDTPGDNNIIPNKT